MNLQILEKTELGQVRMKVIKGEPWFVAKDVCDVLGLVNSREAVGDLEDCQKRLDTIDTNGGKQEMNVVNESGLYNLIFNSRKPKAKTFRKWVAAEVLPSISKYGYYKYRFMHDKAGN